MIGKFLRMLLDKLIRLLILVAIGFTLFNIYTCVKYEYDRTAKARAAVADCVTEDPVPSVGTNITVSGSAYVVSNTPVDGVEMYMTNGATLPAALFTLMPTYPEYDKEIVLTNVEYMVIGGRYVHNFTDEQWAELCKYYPTTNETVTVCVKEPDNAAE